MPKPYKKKIPRAKELRNTPTSAEAILWQHLRRKALNGLKFRRQHPFGPFILDFYCPSIKLAIELDGPGHKSKEAYDARRDSYLESHGIRVLRLWNTDVERNLVGALEEIRKACCDPPLAPP